MPVHKILQQMSTSLAVTVHCTVFIFEKHYSIHIYEMFINKV